MSEARENLKALVEHARESAEKRSGISIGDERYIVGAHMVDLISELKPDIYIASIAKALLNKEITEKDARHMASCRDCHKKLVQFAFEYIVAAYDIDNFDFIVQEFIKDATNND